MSTIYETLDRLQDVIEQMRQEYQQEIDSRDEMISEQDNLIDDLLEKISMLEKVIERWQK